MVQNGGKNQGGFCVSLSNRKDDILFYREGERLDGADCVVLFSHKRNKESQLSLDMVSLQYV